MQTRSPSLNLCSGVVPTCIKIMYEKSKNKKQYKMSFTLMCKKISA